MIGLLLIKLKMSYDTTHAQNCVYLSGCVGYHLTHRRMHKHCTHLRQALNIDMSVPRSYGTLDDFGVVVRA